MRIVAMLLLGLSALVSTLPAAADTLVAVAANFKAPVDLIAQRFHEKTGHSVALAYGPSGEFYTQIAHGAPFAVFLSADAERPEAAEREGFAVPGTRFTYAIGQLVLWSKTPGLVDAAGGVLVRGNFNKLAIADPNLAPYGRAAVETLKALGLWERLQPKLVQGKSIGQTQEFVASGNAELGFVALSQVIADPTGSRWAVPSSLHAPIVQQAVQLKKGADDPVAAEFLSYLQSPDAVAIIHQFGYRVPSDAATDP